MPLNNLKFNRPGALPFSEIGKKCCKKHVELWTLKNHVCTYCRDFVEAEKVRGREDNERTLCFRGPSPGPLLNDRNPDKMHIPILFAVEVSCIIRTRQVYNRARFIAQNFR